MKNNFNNRYQKTFYDVIVFCEETRRKFHHKNLRRWEIEHLKFNPHLKVKIIDKRYESYSKR
jgi:hypothetical protein